MIDRQLTIEEQLEYINCKIDALGVRLGVVPEVLRILANEQFDGLKEAQKIYKDSETDTESNALEELEKEWGKSGSQNFNQHLHYITLAISSQHLKEVLHKAEVIDAKNGIIKDAKVAIALAKVGKKIFHQGDNQ